MSNQRSVMTEFRFLDQKRRAEGLTSEEASRYAQLREQVGPETSGPPRSGFDVNAAAARLRESLLPAGLRSRPPELDAPPPAAPPEPEAPPEALTLEQAWADAPFAELAAEPADPLFDPGSLAHEVRPQAWNPEAPGYDPAAPYDEAAWIAAGYDPNATYDWSSSGYYDPDGQPLAAEGEPALGAGVDAAAVEGSVSMAEPLPGAEPLLEAEPTPAEEPLLEAEPIPAEEPLLEAEPIPAEVPLLEAEPTPEAEPLAELAEPLAPEGLEQAWNAAPAGEEALPFDPGAAFDHAKWFGRQAVPEAEPAPAGREPPASWLDDTSAAPYQPAPAGALFGEYDEAGATAFPRSEGALEAVLSFDPAAASAIEPGAMPEGYETGGPTLDPATLPPVELGDYDDPSDDPAEAPYGGPEDDSLPGGAPLDLSTMTLDWQPDAALEQGFELASDGSFGHAEPPADRRTPAWGTALPAAPAEAWESAPALDLSGPFEEAPALTPAQPLAAWAAAAEPLAEELPTIDGAELLEELPPEGAAPFLDLATPAPESIATPFLDLATPAPEPIATPAWAGPLTEASPAWEPEPAISYEPSPAEVDGEALPPEIAAAYGEPGAPGDAFEPPPVAAEGLLGAPHPRDPEPMEAEPLPPPAPTVLIEGTHRVVLHTVDGQVKRGLLVDALLDAPGLPLQPQGPGAPELIPADDIKAIFFMLAPGEKAPAPEGKKVRVTFRDGRQVAGFSPDYQEGLVGFFMIPADTRTNTGRIWVYQSAVKQVAVS